MIFLNLRRKRKVSERERPNIVIALRRSLQRLWLSLDQTDLLLMKTVVFASVFAVLESCAPAESVHQLFAKGPDAVTLEFVQTNLAPVDQQDDYKCTTLHYAARYGRIETAKWLIAHEADVNTVSYNQFTPMHMVSDAKLAQLLIKAGADLGKKDAWGKTPLQNAAEERRTNVCEAILASGFPIDLSSALRLEKRDLAKKMIRDNPKMVKIVEVGSDLWNDTSPLGVAATQGDQELVRLLLKAGAPVNAVTDRPTTGGMTALCNAVWAGHYEVAKILCEAGAECNMTGGKFYPRLLDYALRHSDRKTVSLLVKYGATPGIKGRHAGAESRTWAFNSPIGRIGVNETVHWTDAAGQEIGLWESDREDKPTDKRRCQIKVLLGASRPFSIPLSLAGVAGVAAAGTALLCIGLLMSLRVFRHRTQNPRSLRHLASPPG